MESEVINLRQQLQDVKSQRQEYYHQTVQLKAKLAEVNLLLKQQLTEKQEYIKLLENELEQFQTLPARTETKSAEYELLVNSFELEIEQLKQEITDLQNQLLAQTLEVVPVGREQPQFVSSELSVAHEESDNHPDRKYSSERYSLKIAHVKDLTDLPSWKILKQVVHKILSLQTNPKPSGCKLIHKYRDQHRVYRIRSGDYRICYLIHESPLKQVEIILVDGRDEKTFEDTLEGRVS
ncbi:MAG TPA: hypothetical protein V6C64_01245 [Microcoleaceae cyanobacterium]